MSYREALAWLFGTQLFGIKLGLENIERLLAALDLPASEQRIIHVAGTNGKGSICAMIDSILRAPGHRTGLFTSPHLVTFRERIQVDGGMISELEVARGLTIIRELIRDWDPHPTFFEIATALGLLHFRETRCEFVILETGMGGRLDATNATTPVVSAITPIDYDHQKWLGDTLGEIAGEKAGIIKPSVPVVSARQAAEAEVVVRARAAECGSSLEIVEDSYDSSPIALAGAYQKQNAALALAALRAAKINVTQRAIERGLATVVWPARFQHWDEHTIIDGAHNPAGARILADTWRSIFGNATAVIILAVLEDKNAAGMIAALAPIASVFLLPQARTERALRPGKLAKIIRDVAPEMPVTTSDSFQAAIAATKNEAGRLLITGSLHFAGEALAFLQGAPADFEACAQ